MIKFNIMFLTSVLALSVIFIVNLTFGIRYGFGFNYYWFFETLHFIGGFFVAMFIASFTYSSILIFFGIAAVSFLWEFSEYLIGKIPKLSKEFKKIFKLGRNINTQPSWQDTALDIFLNFLGAAVFVYLFIGI